MLDVFCLGGTVYNSLAAVACPLCVHDVDSTKLMVFVACKLISLDKI